MTLILRLALAIFAVYRVSMFTREEGAFALFVKLRSKLGVWASKSAYGGLAWTLAELSNCPHCAGVWLAFIVAPFVKYPLSVTEYILIALAIAGVQSFLVSRSEIS